MGLKAVTVVMAISLSTVCVCGWVWPLSCEPLISHLQSSSILKSYVIHTGVDIKQIAEDAKRVRVQGSKADAYIL